MEGRKESRYNLAGTCPECGKLIKVEHIICVDLVEQGTTTKVEGKDDVETGSSNEGKDGVPESAGVRPAVDKGQTATTGEPVQPGDTGKSKRDKKAGGRHK